MIVYYPAIFLLSTVTLFTLAQDHERTTDSPIGQGVVLGVFDSGDRAEAFTSEMIANHSEFSYQVLLIPASHTSLLDYLCNISDILFIYAVTEVVYIQQISMVSSIRGIPAFVYDTSLRGNQMDMPLRGNMLFNLNANRRGQGNAISDIVLTYNWPHVDILVQSDIQHDGFLDSFSMLFSAKHPGDLNSIVFKKDESVRNLLIQLEDIITSRADIHYVTSEVLVVHCNPQTTRDLIKGAELLFHNRRIVWLLSTESSSDLNMLSGLASDIVILDEIGPDMNFVTDSLNLILNKMNSHRDRMNQDGFLESNTCDEAVYDKQKEYNWKRFLDEIGLTHSGSVDVYKFDMTIRTSGGGESWTRIGTVESGDKHPVPSLRQFLSAIQRKMYTVVTIMDKPFAHDSSPVMYDGREHCPTPSVPCLRIPMSVITKHGYSSTIISEIFEAYYAGEKSATRSYEKRCCEGLCIDMLKSLAAELQFDYQLYIVPDGQFGAYDQDYGNWSGLVKELIDGRADMVMASFSIISQRAAVIDYSAPYYHSGFSLMTIYRQDMETRWFSYLAPYPIPVWGVILATSVVAFLSLACVEWFSPYGINPSRTREETSYTLSSAIKTIYSLMCGDTVPIKRPFSWSGLWVQNVWGFFSIIFLAAYTANLTSSIADNQKLLSFESIYDEKLIDLNVATATNSAAEQYIKLILPVLYEKVRRFKLTSIDEAIDKLVSKDLDVWIHDTPVIDYTVSKENTNCTLEKVLTFSVDSYGVGFPKNKHDELRNAVNSKVLQYQESGYIEKLRKIYFSSSVQCLESSNLVGQVQLDLRNAAGMFLTVVGFIAFCSLMVGFEHFLYRFLIPYAKRQPTGSLWRGKLLMFFSQRLHRAVEMEGELGGVVFKEFARDVINVRRFFSREASVARNKGSRFGGALGDIMVLSFTPAETHKMTFYEALEEIYEREKKKPLSSIFHMKAAKKKKKKSPGIAEGLKELHSGIPFGFNPSMFGGNSTPSTNGTAKSSCTETEDSCGADPVREDHVNLGYHWTDSELNLEHSNGDVPSSSYHDTVL